MGSEYINNLFFDAGNTTLITGEVDADSDAGANATTDSSGGGGYTSPFEVNALLLLCLITLAQTAWLNQRRKALSLIEGD